MALRRPAPTRGQHAQLAPQMRLDRRMLAALEVLTLSTGELKERLREAYEANTALRISEPRRRTAPTADGDGHLDWLHSVPAPEPDFRERLLDARPDQADPDWFRLLVEHLDERGWLTVEDGELLAEALARGLGGGAEELGRALGALQGLEPRGLGGRSLVEVLLLQLDPLDEDYPQLCALVEGHLEDLAGHRLGQVAKALSIDRARLDRLRLKLQSIDPHPARQLAARGEPGLYPELRLLRTDSGFELEWIQGALPAVELDPAALLWARDRGLCPKARAHIRADVEAARELLSALEQRAHTVMRVARVALEHQVDFLARGPRALLPLSQAEVAERLELHPSTVSRAIAGKSMDTPYGVLALRDLFPAGGLCVQVRGRTLKERLAALVADEDPAAPLSDDELGARLRVQGAAIARRTVAKLRAELGVPSSYRRRRVG